MSDKVLNQKLLERCLVLAQLLKSIYPVYKNKNLNQKNFIETILGAAIWYLPQNEKALWTGKISKRVIEIFHPENDTLPQLTKDHEFPRKVAAKELLKISWNKVSKPELKVLNLYNKKYGKFSYVTPLENRMLMKHQRTDSFVSPEISYKKANIKLLRVTYKQLKRIRARDSKVIDQLLRK